MMLGGHIELVGRAASLVFLFYGSQTRKKEKMEVLTFKEIKNSNICVSEDFSATIRSIRIKLS